ncbi:MAG: NADH-quinone oxidoreductase subunit N [Thermoplasmata archaeon]
MPSADWLVLSPVIILTFTGFLLIALTFVIKNKARLADIALVGLGLALFLTLDMAGLGLLSRLGLELWTLPVAVEIDWLMMEVNTFTLFFFLAIILTGILVVLASRAFLTEEDRNPGEYYGLLLISLVGMILVAAATDLFVLYLSFEMASIATFALVAFRKRDRRATEAAMKFFIIGVISSAIILFGISLLYGVSGHVGSSQGLSGPYTDLRVLRSTITDGLLAFEPVVILAIILMIAGFGFKVATVPFHMWVPDVYEGAPTTITTLLSTASKIMGFVALFKIFLIALIGAATHWALILGILAIATMTLGNVAALPQKSVKRMLAYSSIGHAGYVLIAVVVGSHPNTAIATLSMAGGMYHLLVYIFMQGGAFIFVALMGSLLLGEKLDDFSGLSKRMPLMAFGMMIMLLSLAGIPPLGGFVSKFILFWSAVQAAQSPGSQWMFSLAVAGVLNSALSLYYYARVIKHMYILEGPKEPLRVPRSFGVAILLATLGVVATGVLALPFLDFVSRAATAFFG